MCFIYSFIHLYTLMYIFSSICPTYVLVFYHDSNRYHKFSVLIQHKCYYLTVMQVRCTDENQSISWLGSHVETKKRILQTGKPIQVAGRIQFLIDVERGFHFLSGCDWRLPLAPRCPSLILACGLLHIRANNRAFILLILGISLTSCHQDNSGNGPHHLRVHNLHYICKVPLP